MGFAEVRRSGAGQKRRKRVFPPRLPDSPEQNCGRYRQMCSKATPRKPEQTVKEPQDIPRHDKVAVQWDRGGGRQKWCSRSAYKRAIRRKWPMKKTAGNCLPGEAG